MHRYTYHTMGASLNQLCSLAACDLGDSQSLPPLEAVVVLKATLRWPTFYQPKRDRISQMGLYSTSLVHQLPTIHIYLFGGNSHPPMQKRNEREREREKK